MTDRMIRARVNRGHWRQLEQDVFALSCFPSTWDQRCLAATLSHEACAVSHTTSGVLLGLDGCTRGRIHVTVPPVASHRSSLAVVHRSRHHRFRQNGPLRITTFAQTIVQLAGTVGENRLRSAVHSGVHADPARLDALHVRVNELRDRRMPGLEKLVAILDELDGNPATASELERLLFATMAQVPALPPITRQVHMPWNPDRTVIVDGVVEAWGLIVEADGRNWHARVQDFELDRWRDAEAAAHGYHVMRFTWNRLTRYPAGVVDQLTRFGSKFVHSAA